MNSVSVSTKKLILEIQGKSKLVCELKRHLSPRTVAAIFRSLPLEGNAHLLGNSFVYFETKINSGIERPRKQFKKGDIAFLPAGGSICFFFSDISPNKTMTPIGRIISNIESLNQVNSGDVFSLYAETG